MGEDAREELEPEAFDAWPREKTEVTGDDMLAEVLGVCIELA